MTQDQKTATLTTIFSEVLANLAFMFSEDEEDIIPSAGDVWLETEIGYRGPQRGALRFYLPGDFILRQFVRRRQRVVIKFWNGHRLISLSLSL